MEAKGEPYEATVPKTFYTSEHYSLISQVSHKYKEETEYFSNIFSSDIFKSLKEKFAKEQVNFHEGQTFYDDLQIYFKNETVNKEAVILNLRWGKFEMDVKILNIRDKNNKHGRTISQGGYGKIYKGIFLNSKLIVKCLPIKCKTTRHNAIKQWFLMKIASIAEFGPKVSSCLGFDILMFQNCVQFLMEVCSLPIQNINQSLLYWNLIVMHKFHFVHLDIKPENIMLSSQYKKPIFIDFGLSKLIKQQVGQNAWTDFIGSISFCGQQMTKAFVTKKKQSVDLYYNDLYCLKRSIKSLKDFHNCWSQKEETEEIYSYHSAETQDSLSHLTLYLLKYYLYSNLFHNFIILWESVTELNQKTFIHAEILDFFLELLPTSEIKHIFYQIAKMTDVQSEIYSRIKILYELNCEKLSTITLLKDQEKRQYFASYCFQYLKYEEGQEQLEYDLAHTQSQLLLNKEAISKISFLKYAEIYVEYIGYINNKHRKDHFFREKAAQVYYDMFISSQITELKGIRLVKKTVEDLIEKCVFNQKIEHNESSFPLFAFRLYDLLVILSSENYTSFLSKVSAILNHPSLQIIYKKMFLLRMHDSISLLKKCLFRKRQDNRFQFIQALALWIFQKKKQLIQKTNKTQPLSSDSNQYVSQQFMKQFGMQIIGYYQIADIQQHPIFLNKMIQLFNKISAKSQNPRFFYFTLKICQKFNYVGNNIMLARKVYSLFKENIKDDAICEEYIFAFELKVLSQILTSYYIKYKRSIIKYVSENLLRIDEKDLILIENQILIIFNYVKIHLFQRFPENRHKINEIISNQITFLDRFRQTLHQYYSIRLLEVKQFHKHINILQIYLFLILSKTLSVSSAKEAENMFYEAIAKNKIGCTECYNLIIINLKMFQIFKNMENCCYCQPHLDQKDLNRYLQLVFSESKQLIGILQSQGYSLDRKIRILENILNMGQLLCSMNSSIEQKYHGIINYYQFALKHDAVIEYFQNDPQNSISILIILQVLFKTDYSQLVQFLIKLTLVLKKTLYHKDYFIIIKYFNSLICYFSDQQISQLFQDIRRTNKISFPQNQYVCILYLILYVRAQQKYLQQKILKQILLLYNKLHYRFKREFGTFFYIKIIGTKQSRQVKQRKIKIYTNKLVKLILIEGQGELVKQKFVNTKDKKELLINKVSKIDIKYRNAIIKQIEKKQI